MGLREESIFLRHAQIAEFIQKSKSEKRKAVASIIGYETITDFRNVLQSTYNALQRDQEYTSAKYRADSEKKKLLSLTGGIITSPAMLYEVMNGDLSRAGFDLLIQDKSSYQSAVTKLGATSNQEERIKDKLMLEELARACTELASAIGALLEGAGQIGVYNSLVAVPREVARLNLHEFLRLGSQLIDDGHVIGDECPLCLTDYDLGQLREEIDH